MGGQLHVSVDNEPKSDVNQYDIFELLVNPLATTINGFVLHIFKLGTQGNHGGIFCYAAWTGWSLLYWIQRPGKQTLW